MKMLAKGSNAKRQCEGQNYLPRSSPSLKVMGLLRWLFWKSVSTSSVSATVERQWFCWVSALGVRSHTNLKAQKGVAKEVKYCLGYEFELQRRARVFCRPLPGSKQAELSLRYVFIERTELFL